MAIDAEVAEAIKKLERQVAALQERTGDIELLAGKDKTGKRYVTLRPAGMFYPQDADPSTLDDGMAWYRADTDKFRGRTNGTTKSFLMEGDAVGLKVTGSGYQVMPAAATGIDPAVSAGAAWTNGAWSQVVAATGEADYVLGFIWDAAVGMEAEICLGTGGAGAETEVSYWPVGNANNTNPVMFSNPVAVATATRVAVRVRSSSLINVPGNIKFIYCRQVDLVSI